MATFDVELTTKAMETVEADGVEFREAMVLFYRNEGGDSARVPAYAFPVERVVAVKLL